MKNTLYLIITVITGWLAVKYGIAVAAVLFLFFGVIPGTSIILPPFLMIGIILLFGFYLLTLTKRKTQKGQFTIEQPRESQPEDNQPNIRRRFTPIEA